jgi:hypothetical protein
MCVDLDYSINQTTELNVNLYKVYIGSRSVSFVIHHTRRNYDLYCEQL